MFEWVSVPMLFSGETAIVLSSLLSPLDISMLLETDSPPVYNQFRTVLCSGVAPS